MAHSPVPNRTPTPTLTAQVMTWAEAQQSLLEGKAIARLAWTGPDEYLQLREQTTGDGRILYVHRSGAWYTLIVHENDMTATDWVTAEHAVA